MAVFERVAQTGLPLMVHPHDQSAMRHIETEYWNRGERDFRAYARAYASHAGIVFDLASAVLLRLQEAVGTRLHILHIQTRRMIEQLAAAKARGQAVTAEINPWALFLSNDWATVERLGSYALGYWVPEVNVEPLWDALRDGTVDLIGTDHAPHLAEEKEAGWTDGWKAHTGTPSAEFYFPLLLDAAHRGQISLEQVSRITSAAPASVFRLARKGRVEVGADADLAIVDLDKEWEIRDERVRSKCGWTPYAGRRVRGAVRTTIVRGRVVYDGVNVIGSPGWGRQAMPT
jgi:dihydroorotase